MGFLLVVLLLAACVVFGSSLVCLVLGKFMAFLIYLLITIFLVVVFILSSVWAAILIPLSFI